MTNHNTKHIAKARLIAQKPAAVTMVDLLLEAMAWAREQAFDRSGAGGSAPSLWVS